MSRENITDIRVSIANLRKQMADSGMRNSPFDRQVASIDLRLERLSDDLVGIIDHVDSPHHAQDEVKRELFSLVENQDDSDLLG